MSRKSKNGTGSRYEPSRTPGSEATAAAAAEVHWALTAIEWAAMIPVLLLALSLLYVVAMGLFNDVHDIVRGLVSQQLDNNSNSNAMANSETDNASMCCPYHN